MRNTQNLADFGEIEREEAGLLLTTLGTSRDHTKFFGNQGVAVEFNPMSGNVFLVDADYQVAMMNGDVLEDFITCFECGGEGLSSDFRSENTNQCCQDYADELGLD